MTREDRVRDDLCFVITTLDVVIHFYYSLQIPDQVRDDRCIWIPDQVRDDRCIWIPDRVRDDRCIWIPDRVRDDRCIFSSVQVRLGKQCGVQLVGLTRFRMRRLTELLGGFLSSIYCKSQGAFIILVIACVRALYCIFLLGSFSIKINGKFSCALSFIKFAICCATQTPLSAVKS